MLNAQDVRRELVSTVGPLLEQGKENALSFLRSAASARQEAKMPRSRSFSALPSLERLPEEEAMSLPHDAFKKPNGNLASDLLLLLANTQKQVKRLETERQQQAEECGSLRATVANYRQSTVKSSSSVQAAYRQKNDVQTSLNFQLASQAGAMNVISAEQERLRGENNYLIGQNASIINNNIFLNGELVFANQKIQNLEFEFQQKDSEIGNFIKKRSHNLQKIHKLEREIKRKIEEVQLSESKEQSAKADLERLQKTTAGLVAESDQIKAELHKKIGELGGVQADLTEQRNLAASYQAKNAESEDALEAARLGLGELRSDNQLAWQENSKNKDEIAFLKTELLNRKKDSDASDKSSSEKAATIISLEKELRERQAALVFENKNHAKNQKKKNSIKKLEKKVSSWEDDQLTIVNLQNEIDFLKGKLDNQFKINDEIVGMLDARSKRQEPVIYLASMTGEITEMRGDQNHNV